MDIIKNLFGTFFTNYHGVTKSEEFNDEEGFIVDISNSRIGINKFNPQYAIDISGNPGNSGNSNYIKTPRMIMFKFRNKNPDDNLNDLEYGEVYLYDNRILKINI